MLDVAVNGIDVGRALNEAVVEKGGSGHTVRLLAQSMVRRHLLRRRRPDRRHPHGLDGLIVVGPGSDRVPRHRAMLLAPVSPDMLFDRTLVLDPSEVVEIEMSGHRRAALTLDGQRARRCSTATSPVHAVEGNCTIRAVSVASSTTRSSRRSSVSPTGDQGAR